MPLPHRSPVRRRASTVAAVLAVCAAVALPWAPSAAADAASLPITEAQVELGAEAYAQTCAACHGRRLEGMDHFPPIAGPVFQRRWAERTLGELYTYVHDTMPLGVGGSLDDAVYVTIVAYLLERNGVEPGTSEFDPDDEAQAALPLAFGD
jgi:S-disulfanyl-L-cysteine oxidoreductase SoxD